ncbi:hypothetical protein HHI36_005891 [Cryptolaemus montrouzieri]|uniref:Uncharacterized protein n=1 Tax=Cryptolaemus montrouzieri TaxID=559131 RepID=A0ABD2NVP5_9CUCU
MSLANPATMVSQAYECATMEEMTAASILVQSIEENKEFPLFDKMICNVPLSPIRKIVIKSNILLNQKVVN